MNAILRAAILAGAEIQALALTTKSSRETFAKFAEGVSQALDARHGAFGDYRTAFRLNDSEKARRVTSRIRHSSPAPKS